MKNSKKDRLKNFMKKHKTKIYITMGVIGGLVLCFFGVKFYIKHPSLDRFFKKSSLDVIKAKREEIHKEYMNYRGIADKDKKSWLEK